jgi:hypothetical protein
MENEGAREWVSIFLFNNQDVPCPERNKHERREVVQHVTEKLFPQQ